MRYLFTLFAFISCCLLPAQMTIDGQLRYGNEWIEAATDYLRIEVAEDGMYRVDAATVTAFRNGRAGQPALYHMGERVPLHLSETGELFFFGARARGAMDAHLFEDPSQQQLNPAYGMHTDTAAYFLSWGAGGGDLRFSPGPAVSGGNPTTTVYRTAEHVFSEHHTKKSTRESGSTITYSRYELAEGYGMLSRRNLLDDDYRTDFVFEMALPDATGATATLDMRFALAYGEHLQEIRIDGAMAGEVTGSEWSVEQVSYLFSPRNEQTEISLRGQAGPRDRASVAYARVRYPATARLTEGQLAFSLPAGGSTQLRVEGTTAGAMLYDLTNALFYSADAAGTFLLPAAGSERRFQLVGVPLIPAGTTEVSLDVPLPETDATYLLLASRRLAGAGLQELARYRASSLGGSHRVHTVYVEDLYDTFGYGLRRHPQALRNYLMAAMERAPNLRYLFIIGKGREYPDLRTAAQLAEARPTFFVPSFGQPASDNLLTAPLGRATPALSTGRLAAVDPAEVDLYARKLREVERQVELAAQTIDDLDWMKHALFLGGGQQVDEQRVIRNNLEQMADILEASKYGAEVSSVYRTSSEPIEDARTERIFERINEGTFLLTFYGHSSSQGFDFNIDNPENYENREKYPFMLSLGCYSGDAFIPSRSISERFIFLPDGGAITFAASKGLGFIGSLGTFGRSIMDHLGNEAYGQGVGDVLRLAIKRFDGTGNRYLALLLEQFALSGDPAFRFHPRPGPDVVADPSSVRFDPPVVAARGADYQLSLRLLNLGVRPDSITDSLTVNLRQQLPSGQTVDLRRFRTTVPHYDREISLRLPAPEIAAVGQNRILITVDADDDIDERPAPAAETNNELMIGGRPGAPLTVLANNATAAFPPPYAVVGPGTELIATTSDPLAPERAYRLQVATDVDFSGTLLTDERLTAPGGVIRYRPQITFQDSTTYYWRISPDSAANQETGYIWSQLSFTYLADQPARQIDYALQHPGQLSDGLTDNLEVDAINPDWAFGRSITDIQIFNGLYEDRTMPRFVWNGATFRSPHPWKIRSGIQVWVTDSINNSKWFRNPGLEEYGTPAGEASVWSFDTKTPAGREGLIDFLDQGIPEGHYAIVWSVQRGDDINYHDTDAWLADSTRLGTTVYEALEARGAARIRDLQTLGSVPYTFGYQVGVGPIVENVADSLTAQTTTLIPIYENWTEGTYETPAAGPALAWTDASLRFAATALDGADTAILTLYGHTPAEEKVSLREEGLTLSNRLHYTYDLSDIDPRQYPHLSLGLVLIDETNRTAATVDELYLRYRRPADVAVSPAVAYELPDTLQQGQSAALEVGYENLSYTDMDSLLVSLTVTDEQNRVLALSQRRPPLPGGSSGTVRFELPNDERDSDLRLELVLNPEQDQPERILSNNTLVTSLEVGVDRIAPDLKVYYDGRRIRNGELVSARPEILVQLRDENPYRRLTDSSDYRIELTAPDGSSQTIGLDDERVEFIPAPPEGDNMAEIYFRPELLQDGSYSLAVRASDRSENQSGRLDYEQTFEVVNAQLIANVLPYPNPFTSQTRFVYTLTGSTPPEVFRIQIMTVSGRVVRDIDLLASEAIRIGTHQTQFAWDGTDEYGDLLANGVYLYRVITGDAAGETLEHYDTGTDQYFRNGLGKVVILR